MPTVTPPSRVWYAWLWCDFASIVLVLKKTSVEVCLPMPYRKSSVGFTIFKIRTINSLFLKKKIKQKHN